MKKNAIRLMKHYVTDGTTKARAWYSLDNNTRNPLCVTIYAKDYGNQLYPIFGDIVKNDTDIMTDYFEKDRVVLTPEMGEVYTSARAMVEAMKA